MTNMGGMECGADRKKLVYGYLAQLFSDPSEASARLSPAIENRIFEVLSRLEESHGLRDQWGNWEYSFSEQNLNGNLYHPWLDSQVLGQVNLPRKSIWPEGKTFALCLTHDIDGIRTEITARERTRRLVRLVRSQSSGLNTIRFAYTLAGILKSVVKNLLFSSKDFDFYDIIKMESEHGFHSTFFVISEEKLVPHFYDCFYSFSDLTRYAGRYCRLSDAMKEMIGAGWEIGIHGTYHSALQPGLLKKEKEAIEDATGERVVSARQHWLHYDTDRTPDILDEAGILADSTHGFNRNIGFRAGTSFCYRLYSHASNRLLNVVEIPQHVMDVSLFSANSLEYDEKMARVHISRLMDDVQRVGGVLTLNWHPQLWESMPHLRRVFEWCLQEGERRNAYGCSVKEVCKCVFLENM